MRITCHVILFLVCPEKRSGVRIQIVQGRMKEGWFDREEDRITLITEDSDCKSTEVRNRKMILLTIVEFCLELRRYTTRVRSIIYPYHHTCWGKEQRTG